ncbi:MAG: homoserine kinase [Bacteroidales bacterium]|nr:homoserine kinase [Bacteroidales bacterium]
MKKIRVFAPATVANMGCGFDIMGMTLDAVGDVLSVEVGEGDSLTIVNKTPHKLPENVEQNVITPAVRAFLAAYGCPMSVTVTVEKKIAPGSGIGSSAASSSAAVYALNELLDHPFPDERLVEFAMEGEKLISGGTPHADNVGPSILGGVVLLRGYDPLDVVRLPVPGRFCCTVAHPDIMVSTKEAREVLPKDIPLRMAVKQWGNVAGLVAGLAEGDVALIGRSMQDVVVEPYRKHFIPGFDELRKKVLEIGALAMNISGAGPSVFALCENMTVADKVGEVMKAHFLQYNIDSRIYVSKISNRGARTLEDYNF